MIDAVTSRRRLSEVAAIGGKSADLRSAGATSAALIAAQSVSRAQKYKRLQGVPSLEPVASAWRLKAV